MHLRPAFEKLFRGLGRQPASGRYRPELDGLRCLAILVVMVWHVSLKVMRFTSLGSVTEGVDDPQVALVPDGAVGVQLFFFLSGYVICRPFLRPQRGPLGGLLRDFYRGRLIRILPPHALVLLASYLAIAVFGVTPQRAPSFEGSTASLGHSLLASLLYLHGLLFSAPPRLNPPGWSLEIEVQFYVLAPALILGTLGLHRARARLALGIAAILAGTAFRLWLTEAYGEYGHFRWTLLNHFPVFMLGIVTADLTREEPGTAAGHGRAYDALCLASLALLLACGLLRHPADWMERAAAYAATLAAILGLYLGASRGPRARRLLALRPVAFTGAACYSIYLTHVPVMHLAGSALFRLLPVRDPGPAWLAGMAALMPLSLAAGFIFHSAVERPFLRLAARRATAAAPLASAARA